MSATVRLLIEAAHDGGMLVSASDDAGAPVGDSRPLAATFDDDDRMLLRWAALEFPAWPFGGYAARFERARVRAQAVGAALYAAALAPFSERAPARVVVETSLAGAMRLPWELLHDGEHFIALSGTQIVRVPAPATNVVHAHAAQPSPQAAGGTDAALRVLLVTARPVDAASVDARVVARTLYARLAAPLAAGAIAVDYVRPPTFAAFAARLARGYDVVHFDGHGTTRALDGTPVEPSLVFEDDALRADLVPAARFADALATARIPTVVLTACETASVVDGRIDSAAATIAAAGVRAVVAMGDEILVDSAAAYADAFYEALAGGAGIASAHAAGCGTLSVRIGFADWWTPQFSSATAEALVDDVERVAQAGREARAPSAAPAVSAALTRFVGRGAELIALDRAVAAARPVVLSGLHGSGTTALAREAAAWLALTGAVGSWHEVDCGGDAVAAQAALEALTEASPAANGTVRELVVIDDVDALATSLGDAALAALLERVAASGRALVATSHDLRAQPPWRGSAWTTVNVGALATRDALDLVRDVLAGTEPSRDDANAVIAAVSGLPAGIFAAWQPGDAADAAPAVVARALDRWAKSLDETFASLTPDDARLAGALAPFVRGANVFIARSVAQADLEPYRAFLDALRRAGLAEMVDLTRMPQGTMPWLRVHPALGAFLRTRNGDDPMLDRRYAAAYADLAASLSADAPGGDPYVQARLHEFERPNLEHAADVFDTCGDADAAAALRTTLDALAGRFGGHLDAFSLAAPSFPRADEELLQARDELAREEAATPPDPLRVARARIVVGIRLDRAGRTADAVDETARARTDLSPLAGRDAEHANAYLSALQNLGGLQRKLGLTADARVTLTEAVPLAETFDRTAATSVHLMLGDLAKALGDLDGAATHYERCRVLAQLLHARAEEAGGLFGLAGLALNRGDLDTAERRTRDAIDVCHALGDEPRVTSAYLTLGSIAVQRHDANEADRWFTTLCDSPGYVQSDAPTRAFFDASIAADERSLVLARMLADPTFTTLRTPAEWAAAASAFFARDPDAAARVATAQRRAEAVVTAPDADPQGAGVHIAHDVLSRIVWMKTGVAPANVHA